MVRRADADDGVNVVALQEPAVVGELARVGADLLGGEIEIGLIDIADGHDFAVLVFEESVEHLVAAIAQADEAEAEPIARPQDARSAESGADTRQGGSLIESSPCDLAHGDFSLASFCRRARCQRATP